MKTKPFTTNMKKAFAALDRECRDSISLDDHAEKLGDACRSCGIRTDAPLARTEYYDGSYDGKNMAYCMPFIDLKDVLRKKSDLTLYWFIKWGEVIAVYAKNEREIMKKIAHATAKVKKLNS
jgi:hypothetical protein